MVAEDVAVEAPQPGFWKRHTRWRGFFQLILIWLINTAALTLLIRIVPGVHATGAFPPFATALAMAILNALLWPLMVRLLLPLGVITLGLGPLLLNGVIISMAADESEMHIDSIFSAVLLAFGVTVINTFVTTLLALNDVDFYYRRGMRRRAKRLRPKEAKTDVPGVIFLEVDGLAHDVLREFYGSPVPVTEALASQRMEDIIRRRLADADVSGQGAFSVFDPALWKKGPLVGRLAEKRNAHHRHAGFLERLRGSPAQRRGLRRVRLG